MSDPLYVNDQVEIPEAELTIRTSRSTGPGGQHANVTDSRVEVSFDIAGSSSLPEWARSRLLERLGPLVTAVAQGKTNAEIAAELHLSEATVKTHITRIFAKIDATNRVQLTIFAYEAGLVTA